MFLIGTLKAILRQKALCIRMIRHERNATNVMDKNKVSDQEHSKR